jgi:hypothetical protein
MPWQIENLSRNAGFKDPDTLHERRAIAQLNQADNPLFSLSEKKMTIRHNFFTSTSASSSSACSFSVSNH